MELVSWSHTGILVTATPTTRALVTLLDLDASTARLASSSETLRDEQGFSQRVKLILGHKLEVDGVSFTC